MRKEKAVSFLFISKADIICQGCAGNVNSGRFYIKNVVLRFYSSIKPLTGGGWFVYDS